MTNPKDNNPINQSPAIAAAVAASMSPRSMLPRQPHSSAASSSTSSSSYSSGVHPSIYSSSHHHPSSLEGVKIDLLGDKSLVIIVIMPVHLTTIVVLVFSMPILLMVERRMIFVVQ